MGNLTTSYLEEVFSLTAKHRFRWSPQTITDGPLEAVQMDGNGSLAGAAQDTRHSGSGVAEAGGWQFDFSKLTIIDAFGI